MGINRRCRRELLFIVILFSYKIHGTIPSVSKAGPPGMLKEFKNCSSNGLNLAAQFLKRGGERLWSCCLGGEEDLLPCRLTAVNPLASIMELYIVGPSGAADATDPSMV